MSWQFIGNAAIKGLVEGFTEFLPISSTGHLLLAGKYLPLCDGNAAEVKKFDDLFDIIIQFPAILAIVILYRERLWSSFRAISTERSSRLFWGGIFLAFLPVAVAGLVAKEIVETRLRFPAPVALALIIGGIILILVEKFAARREISGTGSGDAKIQRAEDVPLATAVSIGVFQCLGLVPGTSRSGATIVGGRVLGLSRRAAAEYSFFLGMPTMGAACAYKLFKDFHAINWGRSGEVVLTGCVVSFFAAWAVVALFIRMIGRPNSLIFWGYYRIALGALVLYFAFRV